MVLLPFGLSTLEIQRSGTIVWHFSKHAQSKNNSNPSVTYCDFIYCHVSNISYFVSTMVYFRASHVQQFYLFNIILIISYIENACS